MTTLRKPLLGFLALSIACAHSPGSRHSDRNIQLETFDYAWSRIGETYYDPDMNGLDWNSVRDELRPRAKKAENNAELADILGEMMGLLGESHFSILPNNIYQSTQAGSFEEDPVSPRESTKDPLSNEFYGTFGLKIKLIGESVLIREVTEGSIAHEKGVETGWSLTKIDDLDVTQFIRQVAENLQVDRQRDFYATRFLNELLNPTQSSSVSLTFLNFNKEQVQIQVTPQPQTGDLKKMGMLPASLTLFESKTLAEGQVGYIRFSEWAPPVMERFTEALKGFLADGVSQGIVIDLRENPGGVAAMCMGVAGHFVDKPGQSLGKMVDRSTTLNLRVFPRPRSQRWGGEVVVLVDGLSGSTSEIFAAGMQDLGEATIVGSTSAGKALASMIERLPNGDRLQFVIWNLTRTTGERVEGLGVQPDIVVQPQASDFVEGLDPTLQAALNHLLPPPQELPE